MVVTGDRKARSCTAFPRSVTSTPMSTATPRDVTAIDGVDWHTLGRGRHRDPARGRRRRRGSTPPRPRARLAEYGPNQLAVEPPPSLWVVARGQLSNPMNIMLVIVAVASFAIGQVGDRHLRGAAGDVQRRDGLATRSSRRRRASTRWRSSRSPTLGCGGRSGRGRRRRSTSSPATSCCSRRATSCPPTAGSSRRPPSRLQEAALTGESAPVAKDAAHAPGGDVGARRPHEHGLPEHAGDPRDGDVRRHRHRSGDPDGPHRRHGRPRPSARARRCSASSTA